jgi:hypothetical protein
MTLESYQPAVRWVQQPLSEQVRRPER